MSIKKYERHLSVWLEAIVSRFNKKFSSAKERIQKIGDPKRSTVQLKHSAPQYIFAGPRSYQLHELAYRQENIKIAVTKNWITQNEPFRLLYPRSYVEKTKNMQRGNDIDFNFIGVFFLPDVKCFRAWVLEFVSQHFTENSYFKINCNNKRILNKYRPLGSFDFTLKHPPGFIPKSKQGDRTFFDKFYFEILCRSKFTLCPRGDKPWSMRFFEAIMCKSIPIIEDPLHSGRNTLEREIGYHYYLLGDDFKYNESWVEENYRLFLKYQTLINP